MSRLCGRDDQVLRTNGMGVSLPLPSQPHAIMTLERVMAAALDHFSDRLLAGARTDLLVLAKLPFVKSRTAYVPPT